MEYLQYFFNPSHLFSLRPPVMSSRAAIILAVIFGAFIVAAIVSKVLNGKTKDGLMLKAYRKIFHLGLTIGILGFVYIFFAVEGIVLLSNRLVILILFLIAAIWAGFIGKYIIKDVPENRKKIQEKRNFEKYIP